MPPKLQSYHTPLPKRTSQQSETGTTRKDCLAYARSLVNAASLAGPHVLIATEEDLSKICTALSQLKTRGVTLSDKTMLDMLHGSPQLDALSEFHDLISHISAIKRLKQADDPSPEGLG